MQFSNDFRSTYDTIVDRWLGLDPADGSAAEAVRDLHWPVRLHRPLGGGYSYQRMRSARPLGRALLVFGDGYRTASMRGKPGTGQCRHPCLALLRGITRIEQAAGDAHRSGRHGHRLPERRASVLACGVRRRRDSGARPGRGRSVSCRVPGSRLVLVRSGAPSDRPR